MRKAHAHKEEDGIITPVQTLASIKEDRRFNYNQGFFLDEGGSPENISYMGGGTRKTSQMGGGPGEIAPRWGVVLKSALRWVAFCKTPFLELG